MLYNAYCVRTSAFSFEFGCSHRIEAENRGRLSLLVTSSLDFCKWRNKVLLPADFIPPINKFTIVWIRKDWSYCDKHRWCEGHPSYFHQKEIRWHRIHSFYYNQYPFEVKNDSMGRLILCILIKLNYHVHHISHFLSTNKDFRTSANYTIRSHPEIQFGEYLPTSFTNACLARKYQSVNMYWTPSNVD